MIKIKNSNTSNPIPIKDENNTQNQDQITTFVNLSIINTIVSVVLKEKLILIFFKFSFFILVNHKIIFNQSFMLFHKSIANFNCFKSKKIIITIIIRL